MLTPFSYAFSCRRTRDVLSDFCPVGVSAMLKALVACPQYNSGDLFLAFLQQLQKTILPSTEDSVLCEAFYSISRVFNVSSDASDPNPGEPLRLSQGAPLSTLVSGSHAAAHCEAEDSGLWQATLSRLVAAISDKMDQLIWRDIIDVGKAIAALKSNGGQVAYSLTCRRNKHLSNIRGLESFVARFESTFYAHLRATEVAGRIWVIILRVLVHSATAIPSDIEYKVIQGLKQSVPIMDSLDLSQTVWGLVRLKDLLAGDYKSLVQRIARRCSVPTLSPKFRHVAHVIWGLGMFSCSEFNESLKELENLAISSIRNGADGVHPLHISHLIEGFAKLEYRPKEELFEVLQGPARRFAPEDWYDGRRRYGHVSTVQMSLSSLGLNADHPFACLMQSIRQQLSKSFFSISMVQEADGALTSGEGDDLALARGSTCCPPLSDSKELHEPSATDNAVSCAGSLHMSKSSPQGRSAGADAGIAVGTGRGRGRPVPAWQTRRVNIDDARGGGGGMEAKLRWEDKREGKRRSESKDRSGAAGRDGNKTKVTWVAGRDGGSGYGKERERKRGAPWPEPATSRGQEQRTQTRVGICICVREFVCVRAYARARVYYCIQVSHSSRTMLLGAVPRA